MSKPNMYCGECPYWLAYGEPETTAEQNEAILAHCAKCYFDPDEAERINRMMHAAEVERDNYDPYTGKYAFVSPNDEEHKATEEEHDNLMRSLGIWTSSMSALGRERNE